MFGDVAKALIDRAMGEETFLSSRWITQTALALIIYYLILQKDMHKLKYAGLFLFFSVLAFILLLFIHLMVRDENPADKVEHTQTVVDIAWFASFPTIISSFNILPAFFPVYSSLKHKTMGHAMSVGWGAAITLFIIYTFTPLLAYELYGDGIKTNLLLNVSAETGTLPVMLCFIFMAIAVVQIPIIFFVGKEAVLIIFDEITRKSYSRPPKPNQVGSDMLEEKPQKKKLDIIPEVLSSKADSGNSEDKACNQQNLNLDEEDVVQLDAECDGGEGQAADIPVPDEENPNQESQMQLNYATENENAQPKNVEDHEGYDIKPIDTNFGPAAFLGGWTPDPKEYLKMKPVYYYIVTTVTYLIVLLLSILVGDVAIFFGIVGSTTGIFSLMVAPGSFFIISFHKTSQKFNSKWDYIVYILAWIYLVLGVIILFALIG